MYVDKNLLIANAEDVFGVAGTQYCDYSIDLKDTGQYADLGKGKPVAVVFTVDTAFAGTAGSLITFQVLADVDLTIDASSKVVAQSGIIPVTALTLGKVIVVPIPAGVLPAFGTTYDHIGAGVLTSVQTSSAGAISAFVAFDW